MNIVIPSRLLRVGLSLGVSVGLASAFIASHAAEPRILTINCWNEWTEGSYLEPDIVYGMQYLEALRSVFNHE